MDYRKNWRLEPVEYQLQYINCTSQRFKVKLLFIKIRLMYDDDFDAVVRIDEKVRKDSRLEYYILRFGMVFEIGEYLPTSLVAENENGTVIGF